MAWTRGEVLVEIGSYPVFINVVVVGSYRAANRDAREISFLIAAEAEHPLREASSR